MKVLTFSRFFPAYHPRKGEPTFFVEKINKSLGWEHGIPFGDETEAHFKNLGIEYSHEIYKNSLPKFHTIRSGNRWKVGDKFSPRVWSGAPYKSKQIEIAPPIEVKKVWEFKFIPKTWIDESSIEISGRKIEAPEFNLLAMNDGLSTYDLLYWFGEGKEMSTKRKPFAGQIICWAEKINY